MFGLFLFIHVCLVVELPQILMGISKGGHRPVSPPPSPQPRSAKRQTCAGLLRAGRAPAVSSTCRVLKHSCTDGFSQAAAAVGELWVIPGGCGFPIPAQRY